MAFKYEINGEIVEFDKEPSEKEIDEASSDLGLNKIGLVGNVTQKSFNEGNRNILGNIFERPSAASRSGIRGILDPNKSGVEEFIKGSVNPTGVETFQDEFIRKAQFTTSPTLNAVLGMPASAAGLASDIVTNPADVLTSVLGGAVAKPFSNTKVGSALGRFINKERTPIADIGNKIKPFTDKLKSDFINTKILPKAQKLFADKVEEFGAGVKDYAINKLKMSPKAVEHISNRTPKNLRIIRNAANDSTDHIYQNTINSIQKNTSNAGKLYDNVISSAPESKAIDIHGTYKSMESVLKKFGLINNNGNKTPLANEPALKNSVYKRILDIYESRINLAGVKNLQGRDLTHSQIIRLSRADIETKVNKNQWQLMRDNLNQLHNETPSDVNLSKIINQLHLDADKTGLPGINKARSTFRQAKQLEKKYLNSPLIKEKKLDKIFNLTEKELRDVDDLEKALNIKVKTPAMDIASARELSKIDNVVSESVFGQTDAIEQQLKKALNPGEFRLVKKQFEDIVGKGKEVDEVFESLRQFNKVQKAKSLLKSGALIGAGVAGGFKIFGE